MLTLRGVHAHYGKSHVLQGVDLDVAAGETVALFGRNGCGRSTTAKAIMGLVPRQGRIEWRGESIATLRPFEIARRGIGYVPESRDVFPSLTVEQNLALGRQRVRGRAPRWSPADAFACFPSLRERRHVDAGVLSGGEQQMLTLCRTLMGDPDLIVIDEPTEGLAPQVTAQVVRLLNTLQQRGVALLLIEQKLTVALQIAHRCCVMGRGRIVFEGAPQDLRDNRAVREEWLEV